MAKFLKLFSGSTRRITFGLSIIQLFKAFLSFFTVIISASYFGTSLGRDVWLLSLSVSLIIGSVIFGPIFEIFRTKFVMIKEREGDLAAQIAAGSLLSYILIISFFLIICVEVFPTAVGHVFAPAYSDLQQNALGIMLRLIMPTLVFSLLVTILSAILNVYNVFYVTEAMAIFSSLLNVVIVIAFAPAYGIYSLVLSNYLSNIVLIAVLVYMLKKNRIPILHHLNFQTKHLFEFVKFALPFYFNYFVAQVLLAVEKIITTFLGIGSLSVLDYARKFVSIPISVIQSTVNVVLTATLTKIYLNEGEKGLISELNRFIDMVLLVALPLITIFIICSEDIVRIFLLHGAFDPKFIEPTSSALSWFGFGIISIIFYSPVSQALVAQGKTKTYAFISGGLGFFVLAINLLLFKRFGIQILAFSWSLGHFVAGVVMFFCLSSVELKLLLEEFGKKILLFATTIIFSELVYCFILNKIFIDNYYYKSILLIIFVAFISVTIELFLIYFLRFQERVFLNHILKRIIQNEKS